MSAQNQSLDSQMSETNFDTEWKRNIVSKEMETKLGLFYIASKKTVNKGWPDDMNGI